MWSIARGSEGMECSGLRIDKLSNLLKSFLQEGAGHVTVVVTFQTGLGGVYKLKNALQDFKSMLKVTCKLSLSLFLP